MANMTIGAITTGVQTVTASGAVTPTAGLDISGITGDWTVKVEVQSLTAAKKSKIQIETSTDSTNWTALTIVDVSGQVTSAADKVYSTRKMSNPSAPFGTSGGVCRANVLSIDSGASLSLRAWVEY